MIDSPPIEKRGLVDSLTAAAASLVGMAHTRLDLLSTDLEEDRTHFVSLTILLLSGLFSLGVGVVLAAVLLAVTFWETHPLLILALLALLFLICGAGAMWKAVQQAKVKPRLFHSSLKELFKDGQQLAARP